MSDIVVLDGSCILTNRIDGTCNLINRLDGFVDKVFFISSDEYYTGSYDIEPGDEEIVLPVEQLKMNADLKIEPVPSNYGRLSWNGSTLTVY